MNRFGRTMIVIALLSSPGLARATETDVSDSRVADLERKVDALIQELAQNSAAQTARDTVRLRSSLGFAPAASKVYAADGISIGGYGEMLYENFDNQSENDQPSGAVDRIDFLRQVFYVGYAFDDRLHFNSEIELEHAGVLDEAEVQVDPRTGAGEAELSGEVALEFAYMDWRLRPELGLRAGLLLVPVGLTNEMHEPPVFLGARRPDVERFIIPTTWRGNGAGVFGELAGGWAHRAYLLEGLDGGHFSAASGIRGGRQSGSHSGVLQPAFAARVDYEGIAGLSAGASFDSGDARPLPSELGDPEPRATLFDLHARWQWRGVEARGLWAQGYLGEAPQLSDELGLTGAERLGEQFFGGYIEAGYDLAPHLLPGSRYRIVPYARFETYDTQDGVAGGPENPEYERRVITVGAALAPHPQIVLKIDREQRSNEADTAVGQWNFALGLLTSESVWCSIGAVGRWPVRGQA